MSLPCSHITHGSPVLLTETLMLNLMCKGLQLLEVRKSSSQLYPQLLAFPLGSWSTQNTSWIFFQEALAHALLFLCLFCLHFHRFHHSSCKARPPHHCFDGGAFVIYLQSQLHPVCGRIALTLKSAYLGLSPGSSNCWLWGLWWVTQPFWASIFSSEKKNITSLMRLLQGVNEKANDKMDCKHLTQCMAYNKHQIIDAFLLIWVTLSVI